MIVEKLENGKCVYVIEFDELCLIVNSLCLMQKAEALRFGCSSKRTDDLVDKFMNYYERTYEKANKS